MQEVYEMTQTRTDCICKAGYRLVKMWQCDWKKLKVTDGNMKTFVDFLQLITRLEPCEAFFGVRTNAVKLYHQADKGEKIHSTSLYPYINKNCDYPVGHTAIISEPSPVLWTVHHGTTAEIVSPSLTVR